MRKPQGHIKSHEISHLGLMRRKGFLISPQKGESHTHTHTQQKPGQSVYFWSDACKNTTEGGRVRLRRGGKGLSH